MKDIEDIRAKSKEFDENTAHDWLQIVARKIRKYDENPSDETAQKTLNSIFRMMLSIQVENTWSRAEDDDC